MGVACSCIKKRPKSTHTQHQQSDGVDTTELRDIQRDHHATANSARHNGAITANTQFIVVHNGRPGRHVIHGISPTAHLHTNHGRTVVLLSSSSRPDLKALVLDTLRLLRTLITNDQEPPWAMLQLHKIADEENGWVRVVDTLISVIPYEDPLGPAAITLLLDECPLPTKESVEELLNCLQLSSHCSPDDVSKHCNICVVFGCLAEKMAGPSSVWLFSDVVINYLFSNLNWERDPCIILFTIIALEKFAYTSENKFKILDRLTEHSCLEQLEAEHDCRTNFVRRQVGFCAQWCLDNLFVQKERVYSYKTVDMSRVNAMLNSHDVSEYLKLSSNGLEARCDASSFESVRCTFQVGDEGVWYYEVLIVTAGIMQIGWATKDSKFLNYEGYGIGDDEHSIAYDGCRQLIWYNAKGTKHEHPCWKSGDVLGILLDVDNKQVIFSLNGDCLPPCQQLFDHTTCGFFAAASFMSFQQCCFNFGADEFRFPPSCDFRCFNDSGVLTDEDKVILPRLMKLKMISQMSVHENSCTLCADNVACVTLQPCQHSGFCMACAVQLEICPLCRECIIDRLNDSSVGN